MAGPVSGEVELTVGESSQQRLAALQTWHKAASKDWLLHVSFLFCLRERSPSREFNPDAAKGVRFMIRQQSPRAGPRNVSRIATAGRFCSPVTRAHELLA